MAAQTLFEKIWNSHVVHESPGEPALLYIDLHLIHEVTSPQAFEGLATAGRKVRRPDRTFATLDHNVPTTDRSLPITDPDSKAQIDMMRKNCRGFGVRLFVGPGRHPRDQSNHKPVHRRVWPDHGEPDRDGQ